VPVPPAGGPAVVPPVEVLPCVPVEDVPSFPPVVVIVGSGDEGEPPVRPPAPLVGSAEYGATHDRVVAGGAASAGLPVLATPLPAPAAGAPPVADVVGEAPPPPLGSAPEVPTPTTSFWQIQFAGQSASAAHEVARGWQ